MAGEDGAGTAYICKKANNFEPFREKSTLAVGFAAHFSFPGALRRRAGGPVLPAAPGRRPRVDLDGRLGASRDTLGASLLICFCCVHLVGIFYLRISGMSCGRDVNVRH